MQSDQQSVLVEIGGGEGMLTQYLLQQPCARVVVVEIDPRAVELLRQRFGSYPHVDIVAADILTTRLETLKLAPTDAVIVVGNIPYHITGPILFWLFEQATHVERSVLMVQKEVARRIVAQPGSKDYGIVSVAAALVTRRRRVLFDVPPDAFVPRPEVTSSVVMLEFNGSSLAEPHHQRTMAVVKAAFNQRRKKLRNALARYIAEHAEGRTGELLALPLMEHRAEQLAPHEFCTLAQLIHDASGQQ